MDRKTTKLLEHIEQGLLSGEVGTTTLLQRCIILGGRANSERLRDWASKELNGYSQEEVPDYRKIAAVIQVDAIVGNTMRVIQPYA